MEDRLNSELNYHIKRSASISQAVSDASRDLPRHNSAHKRVARFLAAFSDRCVSAELNQRPHITIQAAASPHTSWDLAFASARHRSFHRIAGVYALLAPMHAPSMVPRVPLTVVIGWYAVQLRNYIQKWCHLALRRNCECCDNDR